MESGYSHVAALFNIKESIILIPRLSASMLLKLISQTKVADPMLSLVNFLTVGFQFWTPQESTSTAIDISKAASNIEGILRTAYEIDHPFYLAFNVGDHVFITV